MVLAIDAKRRGGDGSEVMVKGGREGTGIDAIGWAADGEARGAGEILLTSWTGTAPARATTSSLTRGVAAAVRVPVIASGGAAGAEHLRKPSMPAPTRSSPPRFFTTTISRSATSSGRLRLRGFQYGHDRPVDRSPERPGGPADRRRDQGAGCRRPAPPRRLLLAVSARSRWSISMPPSAAAATLQSPRI